MKFVTTRSASSHQPAVSLRDAVVAGLAADGGLYVPETIEPWTPGEIARLHNRTLTEVAYRTLRPYTRADLDASTFEAIVVEALNFPIPLIEVEPGIFALELFHGPTLAFKDVGARTMARLMAALDTGDEPLTVLAATSGDTGSAVAHAFHRVPHTRVVVLYPDGRVSPTQEAQLTMFNSEAGNVRAYAVAGSFDDCHRLTKEAFASAEIRRRVRLTSANSVNIGRLLPQMVYYVHALAEIARRSITRTPGDVTVCTPSGNFGNLTAGLMVKRSGLPIVKFIAATNANDVVPAYLSSGRFEPRASVPTIANAMDVATPTNGYASLRVIFTDTSTGSITNRSWSFGDGNVFSTTAQTTVTNLYANPGLNSVTLIARGSGGSTTNVQTSLVNVAAVPVPAFAGANALNVNSGVVSLTFNSLAGLRYRLLLKNDLQATNDWTPVTPPLPDGWTNGANAAITLQDATTLGVGQRFYRIEAKSASAP